VRARGVALLSVLIGLLVVASSGAGPATAAGRRGDAPKVTTDGHLRVGRRETIRVSGFPGKGVVEVSFLPTAICEDGCGSRSYRVGSTDAAGAGTFKVRVPGSFFNVHERPTYFRDHERVDVEVTWEGAGESFAHAEVHPDPEIVRVHDGGKSARGATQSVPMARPVDPSGPAPRAPLHIPAGFELPAGDGYTLDAVARMPIVGSEGSLRLTLSAKGREVTYVAPATVTETSIQANLGALGEIAVEFQRTDKAVSVSCDQQEIRFDSGSWVGKIQFHGEEGYAAVEATSARTNLKRLVAENCGPLFGSGSSGPRRGAELFIRNPGLGPQLSVYKHRPGADALIVARLREYIPGTGSGYNTGIEIERSVGTWMPGSDFTYDRRRLRTATVAPPAPFAGTARFDLGLKAGKRWSGDLTVDMPGRADVPLTGPLLRAYLYPSG
jgi:hypothetical protein